MYFISSNDPPTYFPSVNLATAEGIVAFGGDLKTERLIAAYKNGIFPWYSKGEPIIWFSPNPRCVLQPENLKIRKSLRPVLNKKKFQITVNQCFTEVIANCKNIERPNQDGTWITKEMQSAYIKLHQLNIAHSVEVWENEELVGGLYGLSIGNIFCGESMFSKVPNASRVGFIYFVKYLKSVGFKLIDCQIENPYLLSLGANAINRDDFLLHLKLGLSFDLSNKIVNASFKDFF